MRKRMISIMMCVLLICSFLPIKAFALAPRASEEAPVFVGIEDHKYYCESVKFKVTDNSGIASVKANDTLLTADAEGYYTIANDRLDGQNLECTVTATDLDGNTTSVSVIIFRHHRMTSLAGDGKEIWNVCIFCGVPGDIRCDLPEFSIAGSDAVCRSADYKFTIICPSNCEFLECTGAFQGFTPRPQDDGTYLGMLSNYYGSDSIDIRVQLNYYPVEDAGPYGVEIVKTVTVTDHKGGTANCKEQAVCTDCGNAYGATDSKVHKAALQHKEAKSATTEEVGNIEYWYCPDCNKYYSDKDGNAEIAKEEITVEKLVSPSKNPVTGSGDETENTSSDETITPEDTEENMTSPATGDNSRVWLWMALLFVSAAGFASINIYRKKKFI